MKNVQLRVACPTDNLDQVADMYREGLGFETLATFEDHDGFDGVILGIPGAQYQLEFTRISGFRSAITPLRMNIRNDPKK